VRLRPLDHTFQPFVMNEQADRAQACILSMARMAGVACTEESS
jgi:hypothetical protein